MPWATLNRIAPSECTRPKKAGCDLCRGPVSDMVGKHLRSVARLAFSVLVFGFVGYTVINLARFLSWTKVNVPATSTSKGVPFSQRLCASLRCKVVAAEPAPAPHEAPQLLGTDPHSLVSPKNDPGQGDAGTDLHPVPSGLV